MSREIMQQALDALKYHTEHTYPFHQTNVAMEALLQALAQPEQEPKLSDAGVDTNIPLCGLEPKGKGMLTFHQHNPEHQPWCDYLNIMLTSMPPQKAKCNCKQAQTKQEPIAWLVSDAQGRYATIRDPAPYGEEVYKPLYTAPPKPEQWTPVEIGVDVTPDGAHVVGMYVLMPEAVRHVFYSQFHPAPKREQDTNEVCKKLCAQARRSERGACHQIIWDYGFSRIDNEEVQAACVHLAQAIRGRGKHE